MSDKGAVTTIAPTVYVGVLGRLTLTPPVTPPTPPTVGQIWPRGNQIQR